MKKIFFAVMAIFAGINTFSQTEVELKLTMRDGNVMSGTSKISNVSLVTDYGKLEIPIKNVSSLDIGISTDKTVSEKVANLIKQLANSAEQMRKNAYEELVKMDIRAIPSISDFIYNAKYEPSTFTDFTADAALAELQAKYNVNDGYSSKDVVSIDYEYSMGGKYDFAKIDLKTEYGILSIPKEKIKHIDVLYTGDSGSGEMTFKLLATKHISSNTNGGWLKTGIMVKAGQKFSITASGEVTLASLSGGKYKPDGTVGGSAATDASIEGEYQYGGNNYPSYGNVVFKVGEISTQALKAGAKFNGNSPSSGMLYISIYETVYNAANTGSYTVKISLK